MVLEINPIYQKFLKNYGLDSFEAFWQAGRLFKGKKRRAIYHLFLGEKEFFLKKYFSIPFWQKNEALNEWEAAQRLLKARIKVPTPVALGIRQRGIKKEAFTLFLKAPGVRLEDLLGETPILLKKLVPLLGAFSARFHKLGFTHQDFYLCHIFWDGNDFILIDLQRLRWRQRPPLAWLVKDIAELFYSASNVLKEDFSIFEKEFKKSYEARLGREVGSSFWHKVRKKMAKIAHHDAKLKSRQKI